MAVVCARCHIEESFQQAKRLVGLEQGQSRTWHAWHRHSAAALIACMLLIVTTVRARDREDRTPPEPECPDLVPLSVAEVHTLNAATALPPPRTDHPFNAARSIFRRRHQATARNHHRAWHTYADTTT